MDLGFAEAGFELAVEPVDRQSSVLSKVIELLDVPAQAFRSTVASMVDGLYEIDSCVNKVRKVKIPAPVLSMPMQHQQGAMSGPLLVVVAHGKKLELFLGAWKCLSLRDPVRRQTWKSTGLQDPLALKKLL
jgi:hypothetical protein